MESRRELLTGVYAAFNRRDIEGALLGLTILLAAMWVYLPMLLAAPTDVVALNFFFDTLLFCGAILLLANAMGKQPAISSTASPSQGFVNREPTS